MMSIHEYFGYVEQMINYEFKTICYTNIQGHFCKFIICLLFSDSKPDVYEVLVFSRFLGIHFE